MQRQCCGYSVDTIQSLLPRTITDLMTEKLLHKCFYRVTSLQSVPQYTLGSPGQARLNQTKMGKIRGYR